MLAIALEREEHIKSIEQLERDARRNETLELQKFYQ
jgi:hypothetical protein